MRLRADKCSSIHDFTTLVKSVVDNAYPNISFTQAFPGGVDIESQSTPLITYKVMSRIPTAKEIKPRVREELSMEQESESALTIKAQRFDYIMEFTIWAESNQEADEVLITFEDDVIAAYTGDYMRAGVQQLIFQSQGEDNTKHEDLCTRTLYYLVRIEKQAAFKTAKIDQIVVRYNENLVFTLSNKEE